MKTVYFNVHGVDLNPAIKHIPNGSMNRQLREFYFKNPQMQQFLRGTEKRDERFIVSALSLVEFEIGERIIRPNTYDKAILFVAKGQLISFKEGSAEELVYE